MTMRLTRRREKASMTRGGGRSKSRTRQRPRSRSVNTVVGENSKACCWLLPELWHRSQVCALSRRVPFWVGRALVGFNTRSSDHFQWWYVKENHPKLGRGKKMIMRSFKVMLEHFFSMHLRVIWYSQRWFVWLIGHKWLEPKCFKILLS